MKKHHALRLLGGTVTTAAKACGITPSAVSQWPDELPSRIADRVVAAVARQALPAVAMCDSSPAVVDIRATNAPAALDAQEAA